MDERCAYLGGQLHSSIMICLNDDRPRKIVATIKGERTSGETTYNLYSKDY